MRRLLLVILSLGPVISIRATFTQAVAFGDSLSDIGNVNNQTGGLSPGSGYFNGRYSNGPVWIEDVASSKSLPALTYSRNGGKDYAYGGVKTGSGSTTYYIFFSFPNAGTQISSYLGSNTPNANTLYSVWAGGNDLMDNLSVNTQTVVNNLVNHVTALNNAGARFVIVPNLPPLGEIPKYLNTANRTAYDNLSATFNSQLKTAMTSLDASLPIKIYQLDVNQMFAEVLANPSTYGFTNVTAQANAGVPNPDQYLFWDDVHPTRVGHQQIASRAVDLIDTHEWIGNNGTWTSATNWDYAGAPASNWIASLTNTTGTSREARCDANTTVRQLRVSGAGAKMSLTIAAGSTMTVTQSAQLGTGGAFRFELGGTSASAQGKLNVGGAVSLAGAVEVAAVNGFVPLPGTSFSPLTYQSRNGSATIANATGYAGLFFDANYDTTSLKLTARATPGDADLNALVDSVDFNALLAHYGTGNANWLGGDFDSDAIVTTLDFNLLAANFGSASSSLGTVVPEPMCISVLALVPLARRRRSVPAS